MSQVKIETIKPILELQALDSNFSDFFFFFKVCFSVVLVVVMSLQVMNEVCDPAWPTILFHEHLFSADDTCLLDTVSAQ